MLDPTVLRVYLCKFFLADSNDAAAVVENDRAAAGRALVERENVGHKQGLDLIKRLRNISH